MRKPSRRNFHLLSPKMKSNKTMRREKDFLGEKELDENALYGIHSVRARDNFPDQGRFNEEWYRAMAVTKQACYLAAA